MHKDNANNNPNRKSKELFNIPPAIDFIRLFDEHGIAKKELKHIGKYEYFVSVIYSKQLTQLTYVPISNIILKKVIRQEMITRMKDNLFSMGVVECDYEMRFEVRNGKTLGTEPYGYRITENYYTPHGYTSTSTDNNMEATIYNRSGFSIEPETNNNNPNTDIDLATIYNRSGFANPNTQPDTDNNTPLIYNRSGFAEEEINKGRDAFSKKVAQALRTRWDELVTLEGKPEYKFIRENVLKLEIKRSVYDWIDKQVQEQMKLKPARWEFINANGKLVMYTKKDRVLTQELGEQWKDHAKKIEYNFYWFSCPSTVNRVYYNITSMPSEMRKFLRCQDKALVYLDYSNFQPFLLIKFLLEKFKGDLPLDVVRYIDLVSSGMFYAEVKKIISDNNIEIKDEQTFKIDFFKRVFFSAEKRNDKYRTAFAIEFPNVSALISEIKKEDYKTLSINLQRLEAEIVINTILREIAEKYPTSFVLPIHDALICEESMSEIVLQLMKEKTEQVVGYAPRIKQEILIQTNLENYENK